MVKIKIIQTGFPSPDNSLPLLIIEENYRVIGRVLTAKNLTLSHGDLEIEAELFSFEEQLSLKFKEIQPAEMIEPIAGHKKTWKDCWS